MIGVALDIDDRKRVEEIQREADALRANAELVAAARGRTAPGPHRQLALGLRHRRARAVGRDAPPARRGCTAHRARADRSVGSAGPPRRPRRRSSRSNGSRSWRGSRTPSSTGSWSTARTRHIVHRGEIVRDEDGTVIGLRGTTQDVTEQRRAEQALLATRGRLAQEQRAVEVLQEALLSPDFPELEHYEVAARYLSAETEAEIGGDWYDAFALPDGRVMLAVGDVSGHGIRAARLMAKFRHATRAYAILEPDPAAVLARLDRFASHWGEPEEFATVQLAALDPSNGSIELVSGRASRAAGDRSPRCALRARSKAHGRSGSPPNRSHVADDALHARTRRGPALLHRRSGRATRRGVRSRSATGPTSSPSSRSTTGDDRGRGVRRGDRPVPTRSEPRGRRLRARGRALRLRLEPPGVEVVSRPVRAPRSRRAPRPPRRRLRRHRPRRPSSCG